MHWVGDKKLGEMNVEQGWAGIWFEERFTSMNEMEDSCKCKWICEWAQLCLVSKSRWPSMSRSTTWMLFLGCRWERISHSYMSMGEGPWIAWGEEVSESIYGGVQGGSQHVRQCNCNGKTPKPRLFPSLCIQCHVAMHETVCRGVHSNRNWHKEGKLKEGCQRSKEGHAQFWVFCGASIGRTSYKQSRTMIVQLQ